MSRISTVRTGGQDEGETTIVVAHGAAGAVAHDDDGARQGQPGGFIEYAALDPTRLRGQR